MKRMQHKRGETRQYTHSTRSVVWLSSSIFEIIFEYTLLYTVTRAPSGANAARSFERYAEKLAASVAVDPAGSTSHEIPRRFFVRTSSASALMEGSGVPNMRRIFEMGPPTTGSAPMPIDASAGIIVAQAWAPAVDSLSATPPPVSMEAK